MDESEFKNTHLQFNDRPCPFSKAILINCCNCSRALKVLIAERETVTCLSPMARLRCTEALAMMREKALFALHMTHLDGALPHGKEIKVECGGVQGLHTALGQTADHIKDLHELFESALDHYGTLADLPYAEIVKSIVHFQPRKKR